ncbi:hypothetical protein PoB_000826900 [Plakobranchus ocellatus]|uniref:Uncharacterized protein n=1 Tax=Plakobranchus ocellatus TaxID=259542 RepID=A0AAV3YFK6_9GAST|nr:hypothetical protein PoB_000826900 [Plakobranchus ocellatus]
MGHWSNFNLFNLTTKLLVHYMNYKSKDNEIWIMRRRSLSSWSFKTANAAIGTVYKLNLDIIVRGCKAGWKAVQMRALKHKAVTNCCNRKALKASSVTPGASTILFPHTVRSK